MSNTASSITDQAIAWHLRHAEMADAEWPDFVAWLEESPDHARAYDAVARQDRLIAAADFATGATPRAANDDAPVRRRWPLWTGGAVAAAAIVAFALPFAPTQPGAARVIATRDGEQRTVALADGTQIAMNGGTTLRLDPADARSAELERGELTIHVVHDARRPFELRAGGEVIRDLGTTFDVQQTGGALRVAVAEGSVVFQPGGVALRLAAGDAVTLRARSGALVRSHVEPGMVGSWRTGTFSFDGGPASEVAEALRRSYGIRIALEGGLSQRPFTGIVRFTGRADRDVPHLADLIGATWRRDGDGWILAEGLHTPR